MQEDINQEITFRKLSVFMMFMAKGNIARTAEAMKLSSVSVHRALHTLEEGVGCPLFVHKGRNLLPLQAAWTLLEYCQDVISLMNRGLEATRKVAGVGQGRLRIGTLYSLTLETVPRIIMGMKLRRPGAGAGPDDGFKSDAAGYAGGRCPRCHSDRHQRRGVQ